MDLISEGFCLINIIWAAIKNVLFTYLGKIILKSNLYCIAVFMASNILENLNNIAVSIELKAFSLYLSLLIMHCGNGQNFT